MGYAIFSVVIFYNGGVAIHDSSIGSLLLTKQFLGYNQGCQMLYFKTENSHLGKFWRVLQLKMMVYFIDILSILPRFGIFCGNLVYFSRFWYAVPRKIWQPG
jgi:hypothetical protein